MKQCQKCKEWKDKESGFNKNKRMKDGYHNWCKVCCAEYQRSERGKAAHKKYNSSDKGKENMRRASHSEKGIISRKRYLESPRATERNRRYRARHSERLTKSTKEYKKSNPERTKAHDTLSNAIRAGKLPKAATLVCNYCPNQARDYHHHKGYALEYQLDVVPICRRCHKLIHNNQLRIEQYNQDRPTQDHDELRSTGPVHSSS